MGHHRKSFGSFSDPSSNNVACEGPEVVVLGDAGEVLGEHPSAPGVDFTESDGFIPVPFRGECEPAINRCRSKDRDESLSASFGITPFPSHSVVSAMA